MDTAFSIRATVALIWLIVIGAAFNVGRCYDLVVEGWMGLISLLGVMVGGKTFERVKEIGTKRGPVEASQVSIERANVTMEAPKPIIEGEVLRSPEGQ